MRVNINDPNRTYILQKENREIPFLLLGTNATTNNPEIINKINYENSQNVEGFWGTLGHSENKKYKWNGYLNCSGEGNDDSSGVAYNEVVNLYKLHERITETGKKVIERYIDLDYVEFDDFPEIVETDDLPELRLTVFVEKDEGAEVFLQHYSNNGEGDDAEYLLCEQTEDFNTNERDRLTFNIPIFPKKKLKEYYSGNRLKLSDLPETARFVIKILTFKKDESGTTNGLLGLVINRFIDKPFNVLKYNESSNKFDELDNNSQIDKSLKTLILIHGTIASINGSFGALIEEPYGGKRSWLEYVMTEPETEIEQIIGIDHDTLTKSAIENAEQFIQFLGNQVFFEHPVKLLSTSRGGMVAKTLCGKPSIKDKITIEKAVAIACANDCGYLVHKSKRKRKKKRAVSMLITGLLKVIDVNIPWWNVLKFLATQSYQFALTLPGLQSMMQGHKIQQEIVHYKLSPETTFYPIIGKEKAKQWFWGALGQVPKLLFINRLLGKDHDWVLGTKAQFRFPDSSLDPQFVGRDYKDVMIWVRNHCRYLHEENADFDKNNEWDNKVKDKVIEYLFGITI